MLLKRALYFVILLVPAILAGCDENGGSTSGDSGEGIEFTASPLQGFAPLTVTFSTDEPEPGMIWDFGDGTPAVMDTRRLDHTFEAAGVYTVSLTAADENGAPISVTTKQITAHASTNLVVTNFAISTTGSTSATATVTPFSFNTVSATIQNIGTGAVAGSGELHVGYYLSRDQNITVNDIYIGDTTIVLGSNELVPGQFGVSELGPQEEYSFNHQLAVKPNIPNGNYYAGAIVDYIDHYPWYDFPSATDTLEYSYPSHITVSETNERDNVSSVIPVTVSGTVCVNDAYEGDNTPANATPLVLAVSQSHNLCFDNTDWYQFTAVEGQVYKIDVEVDDGTSGEIDPQVILYDQNARDILLFHDNLGGWPTVDLASGWCPGDVDPNTHFCANASMVWKATGSGTYYLMVRTAACDEDEDDYCTNIDALDPDQNPNDPTSTNLNTSPDGVGNNTGYTITLQ